MLFGALFSPTSFCAPGSSTGPRRAERVARHGNTFILIGSSVTMVMAWASLKLNDWGKHRLYLIWTVPAGGPLPREQVLRVRRSLQARRAASHSTSWRSTTR
jgi:hypothetical protein